MEIIEVDEVLSPKRLPLIDVRSPGEFSHGHIPGARSLPLFDDQERAEIGTLYKQVGRQDALRRGFEIAAEKADWLVDSIRGAAGDGEFIIHCWRRRDAQRGCCLAMRRLRP